MRGVTAVMAGILSLASVFLDTVRAQQPAYGVSQLHCTRWLETSRGEIETATGGRAGEAAAGRQAHWSFRARDTTGGVALEGWFDSLVVWRRAEGAELAPDTDGVLGGRFRGVLRLDGDYAAVARPFVPDEVAEVADVSRALEDFFPPLPARSLVPGETWRDDEHEIQRLPDTTVAGRVLLRFRLRAHRERNETVPHGDTIPIPIRQVTTEEGEFGWNPGSGLAWRTRDIVVETSIAAEGRIRQPVRSRLVQRVELSRLPGGGCK